MLRTGLLGITLVLGILLQFLGSQLVYVAKHLLTVKSHQAASKSDLFHGKASFLLVFFRAL